jgi:hypothetical protein
MARVSRSAHRLKRENQEIPMKILKRENMSLTTVKIEKKKMR